MLTKNAIVRLILNIGKVAFDTGPLGLVWSGPEAEVFGTGTKRESLEIICATKRQYLLVGRSTHWEILGKGARHARFRSRFVLSDARIGVVVTV